MAGQIIGFITTLLLVAVPAYSASKLPIETIKLPPGFSISVYAGNVPGARSMALSPNGTLFVGTRQEGKVYALLDHQHANVADEVITVAHGLNMPNAVVFHAGTARENGYLVTAGGRVLTIVGCGATYQEGIDTAYDAASKVSFEGMQYRHDIGRKALLAASRHSRITNQ